MTSFQVLVDPKNEAHRKWKARVKRAGFKREEKQFLPGERGPVGRLSSRHARLGVPILQGEVPGHSLCYTGVGKAPQLLSTSTLNMLAMVKVWSQPVASQLVVPSSPLSL